jgi:hypothetical protein
MKLPILPIAYRSNRYCWQGAAGGTGVWGMWNDQDHFHMTNIESNINVLSTYRWAGRSIQFPASSIIPRLMVQENAGVSLAEGPISSHFNILMNILCLMTRSGLLAKTFVRALIACLKASQLDTDAVKPNTIAMASIRSAKQDDNYGASNIILPCLSN